MVWHHLTEISKTFTEKDVVCLASHVAPKPVSIFFRMMPCTLMHPIPSLMLAFELITSQMPEANQFNHVYVDQWLLNVHLSCSTVLKWNLKYFTWLPWLLAALLACLLVRLLPLCLMCFLFCVSLSSITCSLSLTSSCLSAYNITFYLFASLYPLLFILSHPLYSLHFPFPWLLTCPSCQSVQKNL